MCAGPDLITGCTSLEVVVLFWDLEDPDFIPNSHPVLSQAILYFLSFWALIDKSGRIEVTGTMVGEVNE